MSDDDWFPLDELAGRLAELVWVENAVADVFAAWSIHEADAASALAFRVAAGHHRWHGEVLAGCLPTSAQLAEQCRPKPPTAGWEAAIDVLHGLAEPDQSSTRLTVAVRKIEPWLERECSALLQVLRPIADAALLRWLRFIVDDHQRDHAPLSERLVALQGNTVQLGDRALLERIDLTSRSTAPGSPD